MSEKGFTYRLRELVDESSSERGFAREVGIPQGTLRGLLAGKSPTLETLVAIASSKSVEYQWLAVGEGPRRRGQEISYPDFSGVHAPFPSTDDVAMVTRLNVEVSAGHGAIVEHDDPVDFVAFPASWLRRKGINPQAARVLTVRGDSMEPTIRSGDVLLVDISWHAIRDNGIYVIVTGKSHVLVKRIHAKVDGSIRILSDNPAYPPEEVAGTAVSELTIAGRVMWFGRLI